MERIKNQVLFFQELQAVFKNVPSFIAKIENPCEKVTHHLRKISSNDDLITMVFVDNMLPFTYVLEKAFKDGTFELSELRIDTYKILGVYDAPKRHRELLPIQGIMKIEEYGDSKITVIEECGSHPYDLRTAAVIKRESYESRKQEIANIIAKAMLCVLIDERGESQGKTAKPRLELDEDRELFRIDDEWIPYGGGDKTTFLRRLLQANGQPQKMGDLVSGSHPERVFATLPDKIRAIDDTRRGSHGGCYILPEYL